MLLRLIHLLLLFPFLLQAQVTKKVTVKQKDLGTTEVYYVLKDNAEIKHGLYQKLNSKGAIMLQGNYKQGKKDSVWTEYRFGLGKPMWQGSYENDTKAGLWSYFDYSGKLVQQYNFSTGELAYYIEEEGEKKIKNYNVFDSTGLLPERPLLYIGGAPAMMSHINNATEYPPEAREAGENGTVYISFVVNAFGVSEQHKVLNTAGYGFEAAALRAVKSLPDQWLPAIVNGKQVATTLTIPIRFKIQ